jgi:hypothetical protein
MAVSSRIHVTTALSLRMSRRYTVNMRLGGPLLAMDVCGKRKFRQLCLELNREYHSKHKYTLLISSKVL